MIMVILNLTQNRPTRGQIDARVTEPIADVLPLLDLGDNYDHAFVCARAREIADVAQEFVESFPDHKMKALLDGPPVLAAALERELVARGITPCYAISHVGFCDVFPQEVL